MVFEKLNGIVLRYTDYKDNDRILTVFTRERGLVSLTARGVRSSRAGSACAVKDVLCCGEFVVYERNRIEYVSSSSVSEAFYPIREDYDRFSTASRISRIVERTAAESNNDLLFSLLYCTLSFLAYGNAAPDDILIGFIAKFIAIEGYEPIITSCANCGRSVLGYQSIRFSNSLGGSVCEECAANEPSYSAASMEALRRIMLLDFNELDRIRLADNMRSELFDLLCAHAEYCLGQSVFRL